MRKPYYRHNTTSQYQSKMFAEAIYHNCERIAKELFNKSIRIKKSHFISAINNGNYEMVLWLDKISQYKFHNNKIIADYKTDTSVIDKKILEYLFEHNM